MSDFNHIDGRQIAAARALLGIGQVELAKAANISAPTLRRIEANEGGMKNNIAAVRAALEMAGVTFLSTGEVASGAGVSLRTRPDAVSVDSPETVQYPEFEQGGAHRINQRL